MRISMMSSDDISSVDRAFSPYDDSKFRHYLRDRYESKMEYLSRASGNSKNEFMERSKKIFEQYNNESVLRKSRAINRSGVGKRKGNIIHEVRSLDDLRSAGYLMQRFIMSHPGLREEYLRQRVDGYSETYKNLHGTDIGHRHYDHRRVTDNRLILVKNDQGEEEFMFVHHYEHLIEGDRHLHQDEQDIILDAFDLIDMCTAAGIDCTNIYEK